MASLLPTPELQYFDANGAPLVGGTLSFFIPNTLTYKNTWQDAGETILNTNPVVLDDNGMAVVFGDGDYRCQLHDAEGNLIFDQLTSSTLPESAISAAMLPVVGAADLLTARNLMGVTAAIANAIAAVDLIPGPQGATGATGPQGPVGPQGPAGTATSNFQTGASNGCYYFKDLSSGYMWVTGIGQTTGGGSGSVNFPIPFTVGCAGSATCLGNPTNIVLRVVGFGTTSIAVFAEDTDNKGGQVTQFCFSVGGV